MSHYTQLQEFERVRIYNGLRHGKSITMIGCEIGRNKSTISRELDRNSDHIGYLYPRDAQKRTDIRKARYGSKIDRYPSLRTYVIEKAQLGWSPNIMAGRWNRENPNQSVFAETIYRFAYHKKNKDLTLWKLFPKAKKKRGITRKQRSTGGISHRISIHNRPAEIETRETIGHYEADLMFNSGSQSANVLTVVERKSRMVVLVKHTSKHSEPVITSLKKRIGKIAKSCTFDNGKEFALHYKLGIPTFFCNPGSPWQKGAVENMNGLLRRYLPFSLASKVITQKYLDRVAYIMNNTPRKILEFLTPMEVFLHNEKNQSESRVKPALPAGEVVYLKNRNVALHY